MGEAQLNTGLKQRSSTVALTAAPRRGSALSKPPGPSPMVPGSPGRWPPLLHDRTAAGTDERRKARTACVRTRHPTAKIEIPDAGTSDRRQSESPRLSGSRLFATRPVGGSRRIRPRGARARSALSVPSSGQSPKAVRRQVPKGRSQARRCPRRNQRQRARGRCRSAP